MALELKLNYNQSKNGKQLVFKDESNWGEGVTPVAITDITSATLTITYNDEVSVIDISAEFLLNDPELLTWEVLSQDLDAAVINEIFEDGIYTIKYEVTTATDTYTVDGNILLYFNVKQHVYKYFMNLNDNWTCDLCDSQAVEWGTNLSAALQALEYTAYLGNITRINRNLDFLQKMIKSTTLYELNK